MENANLHQIQDSVLVFEAEKDSLRFLKDALHDEGFVVFRTSDKVQVLKVIREDTPDMIILDVMHNENSYLDLLTRLRQEFGIPIIILSPKQDVVNKVRYLEIGAHDVIIKPYNNEELIARIRALLRLTKMRQLPVKSRITIGKLKIDFATHYVRVSGHKSKLSRKEYDLLYELVLNAGNVLTFNHILQHVWGFQDEMAREYVHSYIKLLRSKIEPDPHNPRFIISLPGVGYMFKNISRKSI